MIALALARLQSRLLRQPHRPDDPRPAVDLCAAATASSSWRGCGGRPRSGCSKRSAACGSSIAASRTFPRAATSSPPNTNPSSKPSRCSNTRPTSPSCSSGNWSSCPLFGLYLVGGRQIAIDRARGHSRAVRRSSPRRAKSCARGRQVFIFPEGTRRPPGAPPRYKYGVAALYAETGAPCLPVALNTGLFWGRRGFTRRPGVAVIEYLPPILPGLDRDAFAERLQATMETACRRLNAEAVAADPSLAPVLAAGAATIDEAKAACATGGLTESDICSSFVLFRPHGDGSMMALLDALSPRPADAPSRRPTAGPSRRLRPPPSSPRRTPSRSPPSTARACRRASVPGAGRRGDAISSPSTTRARVRPIATQC